MKRIIALFLVALTASFTVAAQELPGAVTKKFIAFGWEFGFYNDPAFLLENADLFASTGIDGVGLYPSRKMGDRAKPYSVINDPEWKREDFAHQIPLYRKLTQKKGFQHSFLKAFHAPTNHVEWTDDAFWGKVASSMQVAAWLAKSGGMKGLCIDHEDYKMVEQFKRHEGELPYQQLKVLVRRRARDIFRGVFKEFPDAVLLSYWFLTANKSYFNAADPIAVMTDNADLWPAFVNGILDVMPPSVKFVDGNEEAYRYEADKNDFLLSSVQQRDRILGVVEPENRAKYRSQLRVGFGLYLDSYVNPAKRPDGADNIFYMGPVNGSRLAHFEKNANAAAYSASEYIWLWGEKKCWVPWKTDVPKWLGSGSTWEQALPGLADMLFAVKNPDGFLSDKLRRGGRLDELATNPSCNPSTALANGMHMTTNSAFVPKEYGFWQAIGKRFRSGVAGVDVGGGENGGSALVAKGVQNGCFMLRIDGVTSGEYYGVAVSAKGNASISCAWQKNGMWQWFVPAVNLPLKGKEGSWRRASGLVRVPEGIDRLVLKASFNQDENDVVRFDNFSVARMIKFQPEFEKGKVWRPTERWRGFNLQDSHWKHGRVEFDENDFLFMKEFGFNFARLPLNYRRWLKDPDDWESIDPAKFAFLDRAISLGEKYGIHVMVNLHRAPGYTVAGGKPEPASLWTSAEAERVFLKHWKFIAERYKDVPPYRLSFNPVNEPATALDEATYARVMSNVVSVIRSVTPERFVVVDGMGGDRHPVSMLFADKGIGQATRGYIPEAVSQWKPERNGKLQPLPEWPRVGIAPSGVIAGPGKPHLVAPLVFQCSGPGVFTFFPKRVSGECELVAKSGEKVLSRLLLTPKFNDRLWTDVNDMKRWNLMQGTYRGEWRFELPAGMKNVSITCEKGDWMDFSRIEFSSPDGKKRVSTPFYHRFAPPINFRLQLRGWAGDIKGFYPVGNDGKWDLPKYRDPGKEYLYRQVVKAWEKPIAENVFSFCGEMGPMQSTPHNIQLSLLEDYLQLFKERNMGWAVWQLRGETGVMDSMRKDVDYTSWRGHKLDREMLELLQRY